MLRCGINKMTNLAKLEKFKQHAETKYIGKQTVMALLYD